MRSRRGTLLVVLSSAFFATTAVLMSLAYGRGLEPLQLLVWRFGIAWAVLTLWLLIRRRGDLLVPAADVGRFAVLSIAGYGAAALCFAFAVRYAPASVVGILLYTYPAMVVIAEGFMEREWPSRARVMAVMLTFAGCVLVVDPFGVTGPVRPIGILLGIGAGAGYASFTIMSHRLLPGRSRAVMMDYMFGFTALLAGAVAVLSGASLSAVTWDAGSWLLMGVIVLVPTFGAILLYWAALKIVGASEAALFSTAEPLFTIAFAAILLGESLSPIQWAGAVLVLAGVLVVERYATPTPPPSV